MMHRAGLTIFYGIVFVAALEVCARMDDRLRWGAPLVAWYSLEQIRMEGPGAPRNRPGSSFQHFRINQHGFRGGDFPVQKPAGTIRVALVGASETFGLYESPDHELSAQLQKTLDAAAPHHYEVINAASVGMTPPRIRELFHQWLHRFDIDVVMFYPTPSLYLDEKPPREADIDATGPPQPVVGPWYAPRILLRWRTLVKETLPGPLQIRMKEWLIERDRQRYGHDRVWTTAPADRLELFIRHVRELIDDLRSTGTSVILATHANRFSDNWAQNDREMMVGWVKFFSRATPECLLDMERQANRAVMQLGEERHLPVVDLAAALPKDRAYFADFAHFTDAGAQIAADALAKAIIGLRPSRTTAQGDRR